MSEFGKGMRVRIVEGETEGIEGEIFWWGRSKWGHGMRAGITGDDGEKYWAAATEIRAIDEAGEELDPQPVIGPPKPIGPQVRHCELSYPFARAISAARIKRGWPASKSNEAVVRIDRLRATEEEMGCTIPDGALAYIASGLGRISEPAGIIGLTEEFHLKAEGASPHALASLVVFDRDNGNYLAFPLDATADDMSFEYLVKEDGFRSIKGDLMDKLTAEVGDPGSFPRSIQAFRVMWDFSTEPEDPINERIDVWINHKTFGRGLVLAREVTPKGDKLTIRFTDGEERKLLGKFVEYE